MLSANSIEHPVNITPVLSANSINITPAYLAGFFDGEGCIRIQRASRDRYGLGAKLHFSLSAILANTHLEIIELIHAQYGGGIIGPVKRYDSRHKPHNRVTWCGKSAVELIRLMYPYLIVKREQARVALSFYDFQSTTSVPGLTHKPDNVVQMNSMAGEMAALNRKGVA